MTHFTVDSLRQIEKKNHKHHPLQSVSFFGKENQQGHHGVIRDATGSAELPEGQRSHQGVSGAATGSAEPPRVTRVVTVATSTITSEPRVLRGHSKLRTEIEEDCYVSLSGEMKCGKSMWRSTPSELRFLFIYFFIGRNALLGVAFQTPRDQHVGKNLSLHRQAVSRSKRCACWDFLKLI